MEVVERLAIEADCTRLINQFSLYTDRFDYERAVELFVPDCTFSRADEVFEGHDGLRFVLNRRDRNRVTRHIVSNILIDVIDGNAAAGQAYALVFGHRGTLAEGEEAPLGTPDSLVLFSGRFTRADAGWRIAKWHIGLSFRKPVE